MAAIFAICTTRSKISDSAFHYVERLEYSRYAGIGSGTKVFPMPATTEIRALHRGLKMLELANLNNGAQLRDFVRLTGLPKTTTYRILENLCAGGYLTRATDDDHYYLTLQVRRLSDGYYDGGWISDVARPILRTLCDALGYPVAIATPYGTSMMLRDNTDAQSTLIADRYTRGTLLPMFSSASGKVYLTFCDEVTRKTLLDVCATSTDPAHEMARHPHLIARMIKKVRQQGYAFGRGEPGSDAEIRTSTSAIPIFARETLIGCLAIRYIDSHVSREDVARKYLPTLMQHARLIGRDVSRFAV
jgi:DNA-binding IclR family transcriptional regulator